MTATSTTPTTHTAIVCCIAEDAPVSASSSSTMLLLMSHPPATDSEGELVAEGMLTPPGLEEGVALGSRSRSCVVKGGKAEGGVSVEFVELPVGVGGRGKSDSAVDADTPYAALHPGEEVHVATRAVPARMVMAFTLVEVMALKTGTAPNSADIGGVTRRASSAVAQKGHPGVRSVELAHA